MNVEGQTLFYQPLPCVQQIEGIPSALFPSSFDIRLGGTGFASGPLRFACKECTGKVSATRWSVVIPTGASRSAIG